MSFDYQIHPEEFEKDYLSMKDYEEETKRADKIFTEALLSLLDYRKIVTHSEFHDAAYNAFINAEGEMIDYMFSLGLTSFTNFIIYLDGVEKGMAIRNGNK